MSEADPVLRLLGLAARAGAVIPGTQRVRDAAVGGELRFAIVAADASENSRAKLLPVLESRRIGHAVAFDRDRLGAAVGRAPLSAVGVTSASFAGQVQDLLGQEGRNGMK
jgi:ribosomal protein L7Ae-like RNA K-turn-binding protein